MEQQSSLVRNYFYNTILTITNFLFPVVTYPYVLRIIGAGGIGKVTVAATIASYFLAFGSFGMNQYGLRQIARVRDNKAELDRTFSELFVAGALTMGVAFLGFCAYILLSGAGAREFALYAINGVTILLAAVSFDWFVQGTENFKFVAVRSIAIKAVSIVLLFFLVRTDGDYWVYALLTALALSANSLFNVSYVARRTKLSFRAARPFRHLSGMAKFLFATLALSVYAGLDKLFVAAQWGDVQVGYYAPAEKLVRMALSVIVSLPAVAFPRMSNLFQVGKEEAARALVGKALGLSILLALPILVAFELLGDQAIVVFGGSGFTESIPTLRILALMILPVAVANVFVFQILFARGQEGRYNIVVVIELAASLVLNSIFVPLFKQDGAAIATVATEVLGVVILAIICRDILRGGTRPRDLAKCAVSCAGMAGAVCILRPLLSRANMPAGACFAVLAAAGALVYALLLVALQEGDVVQLLARLSARRKKG